MEEINVNEVHLWIAGTEVCHTADLVETYRSWLDEQERAHYQSLKFPKHQYEYLVAHALLRSCLSHYGGRYPWEWSFVKNAYGRPEIQTKEGPPPLRFNLSHTDGMVACAVTRLADVGVDVERVTQEDLVEVANASFTSKELAHLAQWKGIAWQKRFFELWTLKEAYVKARGLGLSLPLQQFSFLFKSNESGRTSFIFESNENLSTGWMFWLLSPTLNHQLAVAACCGSSVTIRIRQTIPDVQFEPVQLPLITSCYSEPTNLDRRNPLPI
jgi:4'-phosphopantetheinyl transferase